MQHGEVIETLEHQTVNGIDDLGQTRKNLTKISSANKRSTSCVRTACF